MLDFGESKLLASRESKPVEINADRIIRRLALIPWTSSEGGYDVPHVLKQGRSASPATVL
jgi:hypothetical protein